MLKYCDIIWNERINIVKDKKKIHLNGRQVERDRPRMRWTAGV